MTKAGIFAVVFFFVCTSLIHLVPDRMIVEGDSIHVRNVTLKELEYRMGEQSTPKILILGTSRLIPAKTDDIAEYAGISNNDILNLSIPGNSFFYMDAFLRRNPQILTKLDVLVIDVLPYQLMHSANYDESKREVLVYTSLAQRCRIASPYAKLQALTDFLVPAWSRSQTPKQWRTGYHRLAMSPQEISVDIQQRPVSEFPQWQIMAATIKKLKARKVGMRRFNTIIFFGQLDPAQNQIVALQHLIESVPQNCTVLVLRLPVSDTTNQIIRGSQPFQESSAILQRVLRDINDPQLDLRWFDTAEEFGLTEEDYSNDGIHFSEQGMKIVARNIGDIYRELRQVPDK